MTKLCTFTSASSVRQAENSEFYMRAGCDTYLLETLPQVKGDLFTKASHLTVRFVLTHPLINGNKRVALIATILFLAKNGYSLRASPKQRVDLLLSISRGELKEGEVTEWLKNHSVKDVR